MSPEMLIKESNGQFLEQAIRAVYSSQVSLDNADSENVVYLNNKNYTKIEPVDRGYRFTIESGEKPIGIQIDDNVTITLSGPITARVEDGRVVFEIVPESLEGVGEEYLLPFFTGYAKGILQEQLLETSINTDVEAMSRLLGDVAGNKGRFGEFVKSNKKPHETKPLDIWNVSSSFLDDTEIEKDLEPTEGGNFLETVFLDGIWEMDGRSEDAVAVISRETLDDGSIITNVAIHTQLGFRVTSDDDANIEELLPTLDVITSPNELLVSTSKGYDRMPDYLLVPVFQFLRRAETVEIVD